MEQMLIGSLQLGTTQSGKQIMELYSTDTRLQYPELRLFDLSMLANIGLDPNDLTEGERIYCRFRAYYTTSQKTNQRGNPYRDVDHLEPLDLPAPTTNTDLIVIDRKLDTLIETLREVLNTLNTIKPATWSLCPQCHSSPCICKLGHAADVDDTGHSPKPLIYRLGEPVSNDPNVIRAYHAYVELEGEPPADVFALQAWLNDIVEEATNAAT